MSCFIVSDKLMNDTIGFIDKHIDDKNMYMWTPNGMGSNYSSKKDLINEILNVLSKQNIDSWNTRYPRDQATYDHMHKYTYNYDCISIAQMIKNLDCIRYQSCETDDYNKSHAKQVLEHIRIMTTTLIDGYEQAKWGY